MNIYIIAYIYIYDVYIMGRSLLLFEAYGPDGWADVAWVNYLAVRGVFGQLSERLAESIHRFSKHPLIVVNFGKQARASPYRYKYAYMHIDRYLHIDL